MKTASYISLAGLAAMTGVLFYGFTVGDFGVNGAAILANPWGIVSLVDLYVGFTLFSMWIVFREKKVITAVIWIVLMMTLGFFAGSLYIFLQLYLSKGDWLTFFTGHRKDAIAAQASKNLLLESKLKNK